MVIVTLLFTLSALAGEGSLLSQSTCDSLAQGFAEAAYPTVVRSWTPKWETPEHTRVAILAVAADFRATCPNVRGLNAACVKGLGTIVTTLNSADGDMEVRTKKLPAALQGCVAEEGSLATLLNVIDRPQGACDRRKPLPLWAGACPKIDPVDDVREQLSDLKRAQNVYDAMHDGFVAAGSEAVARAAIKGTTPYAWPDDPAWMALGWAPEPPVHAGFWVVVTNGADGYSDFEAHGVVDTDKDGCAYEMVVTKATNPTVVPGKEKCR
jgi:hypothetical protein